MELQIHPIGVEDSLEDDYGAFQEDDGGDGMSEATARIISRGRAALDLLVDAHVFCHELRRCEWEFAVRFKDLRRGGLTENDLRWMACKGFVRFAPDGEPDRIEPRPAAARSSQGFRKGTRFVLTAAGVGFAQTLLGSPTVQGYPLSRFHQAGARARLQPRWDVACQELRVGNIVVKRFKVPAVNQERVLAAFEEESWPVHIDDPLPGMDPEKRKRRLHDTINSLNRNQRCPILRFLGDGKGEGVRWELVESVLHGQLIAGCQE